MPIDPMPVEPLVDEAVIGAATTGVAPIDEVFAPEPIGPVSVIVEVDLSDPSDLRVTSTMRIEGQYLSARAIDDHVRLAVSTGPQQLPWVYPQSQNGEERATETNRAIIDESTLDDWIPSYELDLRRASPTRGRCWRAAGMQHPAEFSGFDVISVLDLDLADGLAAGFDRPTRSACWQAARRSTRRPTASTWPPRNGSAPTWRRTTPHSPSGARRTRPISTPSRSTPGEPTQYVASGTIAGSLLNQFSLDEYQGYLRAIATDGSPWDRQRRQRDPARRVPGAGRPTRRGRRGRRPRPG